MQRNDPIQGFPNAGVGQAVTLRYFADINAINVCKTKKKKVGIPFLLAAASSSKNARLS